MSDGMSDGRDYGPSLSKHGPPIVSKDGKPVVCVHEWSHIEDHHVYCHKCKATADLCWTCESEKTKTRDGGLVCLKCNPQ